MPLSGWLAFVDLVVAFALMASIPRQSENKTSVLIVATLLLAIAGWLGVLALDPHDTVSPPSRVPVNGPTA